MRAHTDECARTLTHVRTQVSNLPPANREHPSENMSHEPPEKQSKISAFFKRQVNDGTIHSPASSSRSSSPAPGPSAEKSPSVARPAPDKHPFGHHRMTGFDPAWLSEGKYSPLAVQD